MTTLLHSPENMATAFTAFAGENEPWEIETREEFYLKLDAACRRLAEWTVTGVDFSADDAARWADLDLTGARFYGCRLPAGLSVADARARGAVVMEEPTGVPFTAFRSFMYRQSELSASDADIFSWYKGRRLSVHERLCISIHDHCIRDALYDYLEGKAAVAVMGGHALSRRSNGYARVVRLAWQLARAGFVVATGGGPGGMEAANLGAYLWRAAPEELEEAIALMAAPQAPGAQHEYEDAAPAEAVLARFGARFAVDEGPSIGIPTYFYGHEPSNRFAAWHAKMFENSVRESELIAIAGAGVIFTPGSAGTRQEVFQTACQDHYVERAHAAPMVFWGRRFWTDCGVWRVVSETSRDRPYHALLLLSDDQDEVVAHLSAERDAKALPRVDMAALKGKYWERLSVPAGSGCGSGSGAGVVGEAAEEATEPPAKRRCHQPEPCGPSMRAVLSDTAMPPVSPAAVPGSPSSPGPV